MKENGESFGEREREGERERIYYIVYIFARATNVAAAKSANRANKFRR